MVEEYQGRRGQELVESSRVDTPMSQCSIRPGSERTVFGQTKHQHCPADSYKNYSGKILFFDSSSKV